jgi:hypothetical protein
MAHAQVHPAVEEKFERKVPKSYWRGLDKVSSGIAEKPPNPVWQQGDVDVAEEEHMSEYLSMSPR